MGSMTPAERLKQEGNELYKNSKFVEAIQKAFPSIPLFILTSTQRPSIRWIQPANSMSSPSAATTTGTPSTPLLYSLSRAACYQQLGNYEQVVADSSRVLEDDVYSLHLLAIL